MLFKSLQVLQAVQEVLALVPGSWLTCCFGVSSALLILQLQVLQDVQDVLPPVPDEQAEARQITHEIYSTFRMQLAALPEPLLQEVCGAAKGTTLQQLLQPLRAMRPVNGGPGWDMDVVMQLRTLNFDLSGTANTAQ